MPPPRPSRGNQAGRPARPGGRPGKPGGRPGARPVSGGSKGGGGSRGPGGGPPHRAPKRLRARPSTIDAARDAVCGWLSRQAAKWPDIELRPFEAPAGLDGRDAALAHAIADLAVRRWLTLEFLLQLKTAKPLSAMQPGLQAALMVGAAQIFLMDRVPAYAAIDHAVEYAKTHVRAGAGDLANAVLRRMSELKGERRESPWAGQTDALPLDGGGSLGLIAHVLPEEPLARLGVATSHPRELLEAWSARMDEAAVRELAGHSLCDAPTLLNAGHLTQGPLPSTLTAPHSMPHAAVFKGSREDLLSLMGSRPDVWVQDAASCIAVRSVADLKPSLVVDLCAGQGTKTRQLAAVFPNATIVATDVEKRRMDILRETFAGRDQVVVAEYPRVRAEYKGRADLVLLDVPCSNTGVLARRPEAKYRYAARSLGDLARVQKKIFDEAIALIDPARGQILYSTCSIEPRENEDQVGWALKQRGMKVSRGEFTLPRGVPGGPPAEYCDGAFSALLSPA